MLHAAILVIHFLAVILGVGQVAAVAFLLGTALSDRKALIRIVTTLSWSLLFVFVTGVLLTLLDKDHPEHHWWLRLVTLLTVFLGYLMGTSRRLLRTSSDPVEPVKLTQLRNKFLTMTATTVVIIILIATKPG